MALKRAVLVVLVVVAALVPATPSSAAKQYPRIRLPLVPLEAAQLGPAGASFALNYYGSGPSNGEELDFFGVHIFSSSGGFNLVGGYALDYGDPLTGSTGVMEVRSAVEEYRTRADAKFAARFLRFDDVELTAFNSPLLSITEKKIKAVPIGQRRSADIVTLAAPNLNPIVRLHEQVAAGRFVLDLVVTAGSVSAAEQSAPHLLRLLQHRLNRALQKHLTGSPPPLPSEPERGQAPGGPDLSTLILHPSDVGQSHAVGLFQTYVADPPALSDFIMELAPAGTYDVLVQQIGWWPSATEATYGEAYYGGVQVGSFGLDGTVTPVDLSAAGDSASGYLISGASDGRNSIFVTLTNGQAGEFLFAQSKSTLQASDAQSLAEAATNRLDAGLGP